MPEWEMLNSMKSLYHFVYGYCDKFAHWVSEKLTKNPEKQELHAKEIKVVSLAGVFYFLAYVIYELFGILFKIPKFGPWLQSIVGGILTFGFVVFVFWGIGAFIKFIAVDDRDTRRSGQNPPQEPRNKRGETFSEQISREGYEMLKNDYYYHYPTPDRDCPYTEAYGRDFDFDD